MRPRIAMRRLAPEYWASTSKAFSMDATSAFQLSSMRTN